VIQVNKDPPGHRDLKLLRVKKASRGFLDHRGQKVNLESRAQLGHKALRERKATLANKAFREFKEHREKRVSPGNRVFKDHKGFRERKVTQESRDRKDRKDLRVKREILVSRGSLGRRDLRVTLVVNRGLLDLRVQKVKQESRGLLGRRVKKVKQESRDLPGPKARRVILEESRVQLGRRDQRVKQANKVLRERKVIQVSRVLKDRRVIKVLPASEILAFMMARVFSLAGLGNLGVYDGQGIFLGYLVGFSGDKLEVFNADLLREFSVKPALNPYLITGNTSEIGYLYSTSSDCSMDFYIEQNKITGNALFQVFSYDNDSYFVVDMNSEPVQSTDILSRLDVEGGICEEFTGDELFILLPIKFIDFPFADITLEYPIVVKSIE
jgi:hypothetical protein